MAAREITFSPEAALESVLYIVHALKGKATIHQVLKIRYFADKAHLAEFGWIASGDHYCAMKFGPVASHTYDLLKAARETDSEYTPPRFVELARSALQADDYPSIIALREPDTSRLSSSDVRCLDEAVRQCGRWNFNERVKESHDKAWEEAYERWKVNGDMDMPVEAIAKTLPNAEEIIEHLSS